MQASRRGTCSGGVTSGAFTRSSGCRPERSPRRAYPTRWTGSVGYEQALRLTTRIDAVLRRRLGPASVRRGPGRRPPFLRQPRSPVRLMRLPLPALAASCLALAVVCTPAHPRRRARPAALSFRRDARRRGRTGGPRRGQHHHERPRRILRVPRVERLARADARRDRARTPGRRRAARPIHSHHRRRRIRERLHTPVPAAPAHIACTRCVAVEGEWIEAGVGPGGSKHITWDQAREMQAERPRGVHLARLRPAHARSGATRRAACSRPSRSGCSTRCADTSRKTATAIASPRTCSARSR